MKDFGTDFVGDANSIQIARPSAGLVSLDSSIQEVELYAYLMEAKDIKGFSARVRRLLWSININDWSHMLIDGPTGWVHEHAGTIPAKNRASYMAEGLYQHDLMIQHALRSDTPVFQSDINRFVDTTPVQNVLFDRNREIKKMMESYGFLEYYNLPFKAHCGAGRALFSVASHRGDAARVKQICEQHSELLSMLARAVDYIGTERFNTHFPNAQDEMRTTVPYAPLRLLQMIADRNCKLHEAAKLLSISISTANQQIAAAKRALGANTTASAIIQAIRLGLIKVNR